MKDIIDEIDSRISNPFFGYFIFAFIAINWEVLFYMIANESSVSDRIQYFHDGSDYFSLFIYPFIAASLYSIIYPWVHYLFMRFSTKPTELKNSLQAHSEHTLIITKQKLEDARANFLTSTEKELIDRAKRDVELDKIEDDEIKKKLKLEIDDLRRERDELREPMKENSNPLPADELLPNIDQMKILVLITAYNGRIPEEQLLKNSEFDRIKTEYLLETLYNEGYINKDYKQRPISGYVYTLTTRGKKIMVDNDVAK
ncbi:MAG: hypothetical protein P1U54_05765 [Immundisolibacteraceae bacterium]|nr:hypothetical protein [Immundisolibacteraceae bacterium]